MEKTEIQQNPQNLFMFKTVIKMQRQILITELFYSIEKGSLSHSLSTICCSTINGLNIFSKPQHEIVDHEKAEEHISQSCYQ